MKVPHQISPKVTEVNQLQRVLNQVSMGQHSLFRPWKIRIHYTMASSQHAGHYGWFLQATFQRPDTRSGELGEGHGAETLVRLGSTESDVVKRCFALCQALVNHELMEGFEYQFKRPFDPHNGVEDLVLLQE